MSAVFPLKSGYRNLIARVQTVPGPACSTQFVGSREFGLPALNFAFAFLYIEIDLAVRIDVAAIGTRPLHSNRPFSYPLILRVNCRFLDGPFQQKRLGPSGHAFSTFSLFYFQYDCWLRRRDLNLRPSPAARVTGFGVGYHSRCVRRKVSNTPRSGSRDSLE